MKLYVKEVPTCLDCPGRGWTNQGNTLFCFEHREEIRDIDKVPDWCTLPDAEEKK